MTTADVICVMNVGRIEQAGSPEDIYERPNSEFVARFIGMSNVVRGKTLAEGRVDFSGVPLRVSNALARKSGETAVSIRQHSIRLMPQEPEEKDNVVPATVVRQVFLGSSRDYLVEVADGTQLRVVTPSGDSVPPGAKVWLHLPHDCCRALAS
jgi:iron(III) transport system ATP-binding protein